MLNIQQSSQGFHKIFLWAVITNKPDMMYLFWSRGEDFLRKALIAEKACKLMVEVGQKYRMLDDLINQYRAHGTYGRHFLVFFSENVSRAFEYKLLLQT